MLATSSESPSWALTCLNLLDALNEGQSIEDYPIEAERAIRLLMPDIHDLTGRGATPLCPRWIAATTSTDTLLVVHGTDLPSQNRPQIMQYVDLNPNPFSGTLQNPGAAYTVAAGDSVYKQMLANSMLGRPDNWFVGHSLGHGVSQSVQNQARIDLRVGSPGKYHNTSFGGNAWANTEIYNRLWMDDNTRFMNSDDPIPQLPWSMSDALSFTSTLTAPALMRVRNYVHVGNGIVLQPNGDWERKVLEVRPTLLRVGNLIEYLATFIGSGPGVHCIAEYRSRLLKKWASPAAQGLLPVRPPGERKPAEVWVNMPRQLGEARIFLAERAVLAVEMTDQVVRERGRVLPDNRYRVKKANGKSVV